MTEPITTPRIVYPDNLPVSARREDIMSAIRENQVVVVAGETGSGKTTQLPKMCLELGLGERVTFTGLVAREAALARAAAADVFVQVSRYEGHSLALIEAARLGLPLVVSDVAVQVEGVTAADGTRCGIVVPLDDHDALAAALRLMRDDPVARAQWAGLAAGLGREASNARMLDRYEAVLAPLAGAG